MSKLTLPIVIGRKYVRRDGVVVVAQASNPNLVIGFAYVGTGSASDGCSDEHVYLDSGMVNGHEAYPADLVADYIEPTLSDHVHEGVKPAGHPYADILRAIADGKAVQWFSDQSRAWSDQFHGATLKEISFAKYPPERYRVKPKTIRIGEFDVPEPLRETPRAGARYFVPSVMVTAGPGYRSCVWGVDHDHDRKALECGFAHDSSDAAQLHACALLSFTQTTTGAPEA